MKKRKSIYLFFAFAIITILFTTFSCKKDDSGIDPNKYSIGGTVEGMVGSGLILQNNGKDILPITENGTFKFPVLYTDSSEYDVTVKSYPTGQTCYIENGKGLIDGANVTDIKVVCQASAITGNCAKGSIEYYHDLAIDYAGFHQDMKVSGTIPFDCNIHDSIVGTGSLNIAVEGKITAQCLVSTFSANATMNVNLSLSVDSAKVIVQLDETWYVGSPMAVGTTTTCTDSGPFGYPLIENKISHVLEFPNVDGHTIEQPFVGASGSGYYSWTLHVD